jgi:hypothetical protein
VAVSLGALLLAWVLRDDAAAAEPGAASGSSGVEAR